MFSKKFILTFILIIFSIGFLNIYTSQLSVKNLDLKNLGNKYINMRSYSLNRLNDFKIQSKIISSKARPKIGLFGNHQIAFMSPKKINLDENLLHNYQYGDFSIFDTYFFLKKLSEQNLLPSEKIVIFFTTPNNDNGNLITSLSRQTKHVINFHEFMKNINEFSLNDTFLLFKSYMQYYYDSMFDYQTTATSIKVLLNIFSNINLKDFFNKDYIEKLDLITKKDNCDMKYPNGKFIFLRNDGSFTENCIKFNLIKNQKDLTKNLYFKNKDIKKLYSIISKINSLAKEKKLELYFVIPPVYEDLRNSKVDKIFNKALDESIKIVNIFDHRSLRQKKEFFLDYDHVNSEYLKYVIKDLRLLKIN